MRLCQDWPAQRAFPFRLDEMGEQQIGGHCYDRATLSGSLRSGANRDRNLRWVPQGHAGSQFLPLGRHALLATNPLPDAPPEQKNYGNPLFIIQMTGGPATALAPPFRI